jgi:FkbM family methyltransferase
MSEPLDVRLDKIDQSHARLHGLISEIEDILETLITNDTEILEALTQILMVVPQMQARSEQSLARLAEEVRKEMRALGLELMKQGEARSGGTQAIVQKIDEFSAQNPEVALLQHLYSFLPDNVALDIGANTGRVSERLLATGYTVYAFEPNPPTFEVLQKRFQGESRLHAFPFALGSREGTLDLHVAEDRLGGAAEKYGDPALFSSFVEHAMPGDLPFNKVVPVPVRTLESLRRGGEIPDRIGLVKIDTEGFDLEVLRGMGDVASPVVMTEFWDAVHSFGRSGKGRLEDLVKEMKSRGYPWHLVIYHVDDTSTISYYCNQTRTVPNSWGNALFFREQPLFTQAYAWCEKVLSATLYR